jgi:protein-tyrosine phosphatase
VSPVQTASLRVVLVCTANICRSPVAAALLRSALGDGADVDVSSAGLHARVGAPASAEMTAVVDVPVGGRARQLDGATVEDAGLLLTMTREQRTELVARWPSAVRRTFTLREFAALARLAVEQERVTGATAGERLAALVATAPRLRALRTADGDDDVVDPYGRSREHHVRAAERITDAVEGIALAVAPAGVLR